MTRKEIARLGGNALAAKVSPLYFQWLGRRGGRRTKRNELLAFAAYLDEIEPETGRSEIWRERAERYHDETGVQVMVGLWSADNCEMRPARKRRQANTDEARLRRWERAVKGCGRAA